MCLTSPNVTGFLSKQGYFKKITPLSLRMASEQKYKEGDDLSQSYETTNNSEVMFFTDKQQVYKAHMYDFDDTKASALGDYLPSKLGMDDGENVVYMVLPDDYKGYMLYFFENGKVAKVNIDAYKTVQNRKKLKNAYSGKSPLKSVLFLKEDTEIAIFSNDSRALLFHSSQLATKSTSSTQGVAVLTIKRNRTLERACLAEDSGFADTSRYRVKSIPAIGAVIKEEDSPQQSLF